MSSSSLLIGSIVLINLPEQDPQGHEQEGERPAVIIGIPDNLGTLRFPLILIAPFTKWTVESLSWSKDSPELYLVFDKGTGGLTRKSILLLDQIRAVDVTRISKLFGCLTTEEYKPIADGIKKMMGL